MSGVLLMRCEDSVILLTDGMLSASDCDPTLSGKISKVFHYRHMPAVVAMTGDQVILSSALSWYSYLWTDFDALIANFRDVIGGQIEAFFHQYPYYTEVGARYFFGGFSRSRGRWETYRLEVYTHRGDPWDGIGEMEPAPQIVMAPMPDAKSLAQYGFDPENVSIGSTDLYADLVSLMRAMRATVCQFGLRSLDEWEPGHMVGFFIEKTVVNGDLTYSRIVWEFPEDEIGKPIDASHEGNPVELVFRDDSDQAP